MSLKVQLFRATSGVVERPYVKIVLPDGFKILGGGASVNGDGAGCLLTDIYPVDVHTWIAAAKDHEVAATASITAYVLALADPNNEWTVKIFPKPSNFTEHPFVTAVVTDDYVLTGGGARVIYEGDGNLLTASYPFDSKSWKVRSKDHLVPSNAQITAFAIGIKRASGSVGVQNTIKSNPGDLNEHPFASVSLDSGWILSGGGAVDDYLGGEGNLLTGSFPSGLNWEAHGKDHVKQSPAKMTAYAIGLKEK